MLEIPQRNFNLWNEKRIALDRMVEVLMMVSFQSKEIPLIKIKSKGKIKAAVDKYRSRQTPMKQLLTDYLAVKSYADRLAVAENPWAYFYKGIEGHEVETGVPTMSLCSISLQWN